MTVFATLERYSPPSNLQGMTNKIGLTFNVADTILRFTISVEQENRIGDTKYHT